MVAASMLGVSSLRKRGSVSTNDIIVIVVLVVVVAIIAASFFLYIRHTGRYARLIASKHQGQSPKRSWRSALRSRFTRKAPVRADVREPPHPASVHDVEEAMETAGVDRHTSVRSIMTLPAYSAVPRENEGVIGREGERAGMDTVVEFPENNDEEEERREQEQVSLYQIRLQRREEIRLRNERKQQRRDARARGDTRMLRQMRRESVARRREVETTTAATMMAEHQARPNDRRISAVSYGALGVAKHDGSRVRANSNESDRPLLDAAGTHGTSGPVRPWMSRETLGSHQRTQSNSSMISLSSLSSDDRSGLDDAGSDYEVISLQRTTSRPQSGTRSRATSFGANLALSTTDLGASGMPSSEPPRYDGQEFEEAPPYESPTRVNAPRLSEPASASSLAASPRTSVPRLAALERLPSIRITEDTPIEPRPHEFPGF